MGKVNEDDYRFTENAIEWLSGERYATITVSQKKWVSLVEGLAHKKKLKRITVNKDGSVTARIPADWVQINPKEEQ